MIQVVFEPEYRSSNALALVSAKGSEENRLMLKQSENSQIKPK